MTISGRSAAAASHVPASTGWSPRSRLGKVGGGGSTGGVSGLPATAAIGSSSSRCAASSTPLLIDQETGLWRHKDASGQRPAVAGAEGSLNGVWGSLIFCVSAHFSARHEEGSPRRTDRRSPCRLREGRGSAREGIPIGVCRKRIIMVFEQGIRARQRPSGSDAVPRAWSGSAAKRNNGDVVLAQAQLCDQISRMIANPIYGGGLCLWKSGAASGIWLAFPLGRALAAGRARNG